MADKIIESKEEKKTARASLNEAKSGKRVKTSIETGSQIALYPLYGENNYYEGQETLVLPVSPADIMFNEDSDPQTVKLINYGELPVGVNRKLATWSIESLFPVRNANVGIYDKTSRKGTVDKNKTFKYWFDSSNGDNTKAPYDYYCDQLLKWKNEQTPLVFFFQTWGGYYNCQIKKFTYGRKDAIGNVYYQLEFQEFKEYKSFDSGATSTDYSSDTYYPAEGENILQVCRKLYGDTDKYKYFMDLNNMKNPLDIVAGQAYKVR
ncbi:phage baseplate protein [Clostridium saccharoperbutylacetonicum]|uniref:phage baseplate protein n=1 Tax=Clostridium saccharoperbutylacetonicum TaxID=36745 RepID=UPI000983939D|nr:hypothetical protein [Clostridium saccharoperbutylacetonicum]AQR93395.1 hypothetical protein CLSAP_06930 [Clostridium saccharoperbutylacetonicum]NSB29092.1 hypothetical protein [Clostridium saccharoperbutylacetonicum]